MSEKLTPEEHAEIRRKLWAHNPHMLEASKHSVKERVQLIAIKSAIKLVNATARAVRSLTTEQDNNDVG